MPDDLTSADAVEQITQIRKEFERAENASDSNVVDEYCADDIVAISPGRPPAVGKEACKEALDNPFAAFEIEVDYNSEVVIVGEELAFDRLTAHETHIPKDGDERIEPITDSLWVYRRSPTGEWKQIRAIWNYRE